MKLEVKHCVRFGECDPARIVYYPNYFDWFNLAWEGLVTKLGVPFRELFARGYAMPTVKTSCDFYTTLSFDRWCTITLELIRIGTSSVESEYTVIRDEDGSLAAKGRDVRVLVYFRPGEPMCAAPIPEKTKESLSSYLKA